MKKIVLLLLIVTISVSCSKAQDKTSFSEKAMSEIMIDKEGNEVPYSKIIDQYKGKKVVIDVWASWCGDCVAGMPRVKELQSTYPDVIFLFLSLDRDFNSWKKGVKKYKLKGEHYYVPAGWKSDFNKSIELDWIPRYMVVASTGEIVLYNAKVATDTKLEEAIKN